MQTISKEQRILIHKRYDGFVAIRPPEDNTEKIVMPMGQFINILRLRQDNQRSEYLKFAPVKRAIKQVLADFFTKERRAKIRNAKILFVGDLYGNPVAKVETMLKNELINHLQIVFDFCALPVEAQVIAEDLTAEQLTPAALILYEKIMKDLTAEKKKRTPKERTHERFHNRTKFINALVNFKILDQLDKANDNDDYFPIVIEIGNGKKQHGKIFKPSGGSFKQWQLTGIDLTVAFAIMSLANAYYKDNEPKQEREITTCDILREIASKTKIEWKNASFKHSSDLAIIEKSIEKMAFSKVEIDDAGMLFIPITEIKNGAYTMTTGAGFVKYARDMKQFNLIDFSVLNICDDIKNPQLIDYVIVQQLLYHIVRLMGNPDLPRIIELKEILRFCGYAIDDKNKRRQITTKTTAILNAFKNNGAIVDYVTEKEGKQKITGWNITPVKSFPTQVLTDENTPGF